LKAQGASQDAINTYWNQVKANPDLSMTKRRDLANTLTDKPVVWSCDVPRTREGFYHYKAGFPAATKRAKEFAPYADLLWVETGDANVENAATLAANVHEHFPGKKFVYNLSPSFNWMAQGFTEATLKSFIWDIAKHGYDIPLILNVVL
jgi:isocitrate lyase